MVDIAGISDAYRNWCNGGTVRPHLMSIKWSVRARRVFIRSGVETLDDLIDRTPDEIRKVKGCGYTTLSEIRDRLAMINLGLRNDPCR